MPTQSERAIDATLVVLDLDNTLIRLEVDWGAVRDELVRLTSESGAAQTEPRIGALMQGAEVPGSEQLLEALEGALTDAELAGIEGPYNADLVDWLDGPAAGLPVSILSLNSHQSIERALEHGALAGRVAHIVGRDDVELRKPEPAGLILLAQRHGVAIERVLFVGDSDGDRECARRAGSQFADVEEIGVRWVRAPAV